MRSIPDQEHESQTSTHLINRIGHVIRRLNYFGDRHPANDNRSVTRCRYGKPLQYFSIVARDP